MYDERIITIDHLIHSLLINIHYTENSSNLLNKARKMRKRVVFEKNSRSTAKYYNNVILHNILHKIYFILIDRLISY